MEEIRELPNIPPPPPPPPPPLPSYPQSPPITEAPLRESSIVPQIEVPSPLLQVSHQEETLQQPDSLQNEAHQQLQEKVPCQREVTREVAETIMADMMLTEITAHQDLKIDPAGVEADGAETMIDDTKLMTGTITNDANMTRNMAEVVKFTKTMAGEYADQTGTMADTDWTKVMAGNANLINIMMGNVKLFKILTGDKFIKIITKDANLINIMAEDAKLPKIMAEEGELIKIMAEEGELIKIMAEEGELIKIMAEEGELIKIMAEEGELIKIMAEEGELIKIMAEEGELIKIMAEEGELIKIMAEEGELIKISTKDAELIKMKTKHAELINIMTENVKFIKIITDDIELIKIMTKFEGAELMTEDAKLIKSITEFAASSEIIAGNSESNKIIAQGAKIIMAEDAKLNKIVTEAAKLMGEDAKLIKSMPEDGKLTKDTDLIKSITEDGNLSKIIAENFELVQINAKLIKIMVEDPKLIKIVTEAAELIKIVRQDVKLREDSELIKVRRADAKWIKMTMEDTELIKSMRKDVNIEMLVEDAKLMERISDDTNSSKIIAKNSEIMARDAKIMTNLKAAELIKIEDAKMMGDGSESTDAKLIKVIRDDAKLIKIVTEEAKLIKIMAEDDIAKNLPAIQTMEEHTKCMAEITESVSEDVTLTLMKPSFNLTVTTAEDPVTVGNDFDRVIIIAESKTIADPELATADTELWGVVSETELAGTEVDLDTMADPELVKTVGNPELTGTMGESANLELAGAIAEQGGTKDPELSNLESMETVWLAVSADDLTGIRTMKEEADPELVRTAELTGTMGDPAHLLAANQGSTKDPELCNLELMDTVWSAVSSENKEPAEKMADLEEMVTCQENTANLEIARSVADPVPTRTTPHQETMVRTAADSHQPTGMFRFYKSE